MKIFIGYDRKFPEPAIVLADSILRHSVNIFPEQLVYLDLQAIQSRFNFNRPRDPLQSTDFTYTRFLIPHIMGFTGHAVYLDNDMLCFGDLSEIFYTATSGEFALGVRKHDHNPVDGSLKMDGKIQTSYPRKNWSSLMVMDCAKLTLWSKYFVETATGAQLHRFEGIPDTEIADLGPDWNDLEITPTTKLLHYTEGGPWFNECKNVPSAAIWEEYRTMTFAQLF